MKTLNSLQMVRALAAISVIYFHVGTQISFGSFGVDIFFVLSGYVIAMVLSDKEKTTTSFTKDRLTRIVPLYWTLSIFVFAVAYLKPHLFNSTTANASNLLKSMFFVPYYKENGQLFPILYVGWTLNYEMLFYAVVATCVTFSRKYWMLASGIVIASLYTISCLLGPMMAGTEFLANPKILEFIFGLLIWRVWQNKIEFPKYLGLLGIVISYFAMSYFEANNVPGPALLLFGVPSCCLIIFALSFEKHIKTGAVSRLLIHLGAASYATYLSHPYIVEFARKVAPSLYNGFQITTAVGTLITVIIALIVGSTAYSLLDRPLVHFCRGKLFPHRSARRSECTEG
ncbi:MAG: Exopolysaccharide production protein ExoZ [Herminiimonas sp.]|nr:Exopolysaccharide production protein ExoZ [Herminiimonas sp.]